MLVEAISFDIDQTLFDFAAMLDDALDQVSHYIFTQFGVTLSVTELQAERMFIAQELSDASADMLDVRLCSFQNLLLERRLDVIHASEMLASVPSGVKIAALSNGNSDLARFGFSQYFDVVILGDNTLVKKPDARAFEAMIEALEVNPSKSVWHVGERCLGRKTGGVNFGLV